MLDRRDIDRRLEATLAEPSPLGPLTLDGDALPATGRSNMDRETFMRRVERIREYIRAGDCFQALISRRIDLQPPPKPEKPVPDPAAAVGMMRLVWTPSTAPDRLGYHVFRAPLGVRPF